MMIIFPPPSFELSVFVAPTSLYAVTVNKQGFFTEAKQYEGLFRQGYLK